LFPQSFGWGFFLSGNQGILIHVFLSIMTFMKITLLTVLLFSLQTVFSQTDSVYIWLTEVPGETKPKAPPVIKGWEDGGTRHIEITNPLLAIFKPEAKKKNNKAIIVCPGGGYTHLAVEKEGNAPAKFLAGLGYTVFVLHYQVPNKKDGAWQDMQRSIRLVRYNAAKYGINPNKIGVMGFSAGAHLAALAGMADSTLNYPKQDASDNISSRPDCMIIMYPGYLDMGPNKSLTTDLKPHAQTAPTFIFQAMDDRIVQSSFALAMALRDVKANVELHLVPKGGHGFGMTPGNPAAEAWPPLLEKWLKDQF
jgi:acetyl esterase/lipase